MKPNMNSASIQVSVLPTGDKNVNDRAAQAAASVELLLKEDSRLVDFGLTSATVNPDHVAFPYASALLNEVENETGSRHNAQQRAVIALEDVERKLALVESLAVKLSRTSPEAVAGHLLRLHGYNLSRVDETKPNNGMGESSRVEVSGGTTINSIRDRADRIERQAENLEGIANRVESTLSRGLTNMESATTRLSRVLTSSTTLKRIMRLQFETNKLQTYDLEDLRDLTRAAASVSIVEDLLNTNEYVIPSDAKSKDQESIDIVESMRPKAVATAYAVRKAASSLLHDLLVSSSGSKSSDQGATQLVQQLGATLQVYFHLGELPGAAWKVVEHAHLQAEKASRHLYNTVTITGINEKAKKTSKDTRSLQKSLRQLRSDACKEWAGSVLSAAMLVRTLSRVLYRKTDLIKSPRYIDVVAESKIPLEYVEIHGASGTGKGISDFSLFKLFWARFCHSLSLIVENTIENENGRFRNDVAALYPVFRSAALDLVGHLQRSTSAGQGNSSMFYDESSLAVSSSGALGGSALLENECLVWTSGSILSHSLDENPQTPALSDTWTQLSEASDGGLLAQHRSLDQSSSFLPIGMNSMEWKSLEGDSNTENGMYLLQQTFLDACQDRLCSPLQYMFPDNNTPLDDDGIAMHSTLSMLPSKYDIQRFDETIRSELALADPRDGGGDLTLVPIIARTVVSMISEFCVRAKGSMSGVNGEHSYVMEDYSMSHDLEHDRKVVAIMFAVRNYLEQAPDKVFVARYRPAVLPRHQEAANLCRAALSSALTAIDQSVMITVLLPLYRALNQRMSVILGRISHGVYLDTKDEGEECVPGFIQSFLSVIFDTIAKNILSRFPPIYAKIIAEKVVSFTIYTYLSNASLVRPLGESSRLHMTQDVADLELGLEQLLSKVGGSELLHLADQGRPYAELRSFRQMLYWNGLERNKEWTSQEVAKSLLRELWIKDIRSSTVCQYLFSFGPSVLSSPHHVKRMKAEDYVRNLVQLDGTIALGEVLAWETLMKCCESYHQRASSSSLGIDGDVRVAQIVLAVGQELNRRR